MKVKRLSTPSFFGSSPRHRQLVNTLVAIPTIDMNFIILYFMGNSLEHLYSFDAHALNVVITRYFRIGKR